MLTEEQIEKIIERLINRIEEANVEYLKVIGDSIKQIRNISPTEAHQLVQILKYGGSYEDIRKKLAKYTKLNIKDIDAIFEEYAKVDLNFYEQFYKYKNIPFIEYEYKESYKRQTEALANMVKNEMYNFTRNNVLGYTINGKFMSLRDTYNTALDNALLNVGQGKETFDSAMRSILKEIGGSGLKTIEYESGRSIRLDSAVRMHLKGRLRELHNENQKIIGEELGTDGIEISVHGNPAPDHEMVQGRQFTNEEYEKLNNGLIANDYKGNTYTLDHDGKNGYRPISEMNCYHVVFTVILGINKPLYKDEELQEIIANNEKGFTYEGKHYTNYEGTQLQRMLERKIREQKDIQILARESGNKVLAGESQNKIRVLTDKYKDLTQESGLPSKMKRMTVSNYQRKAEFTKAYESEIAKYKVGEFDVTKYTKEMKPTTNQVVFMEDRKTLNSEKHPKDVKYYDKIPNILQKPDQVYIERNGRANTMWLIKEIDGKKVETIVKINTTTLYQEKQLGYKNSIIHLHTTREKYLKNKVDRGELELLFDIDDQK